MIVADKTTPLKVFMGETRTSPYDETATAEVLSTFNQAVLGQLLDFEEDLTLKVGLLKKWNWNYQDQTYEFEMRDDIVFHNGRKADSKDLEFAFLRGFFSKHRNFYSIYLNTIEGVDKIKPEQKYQSGLVSGVKITGPYSIKIKLTQANPNFIFVLTRPYFSLVPIEAMKDNYVEWKNQPIGAGKYVVSKDFDGKRTVLKWNPNYKANKNPSIVELHTTFDPKVSYDVSLAANEFINTSTYSYFKTLYPSTIWTIFFSNVHPLYKEKDFRKAIALAINRDKITSSSISGTSTYELQPQYLWGRKKLKYEDNISEAKRLIEKYLSKLPKELKVSVFGGKDINRDRKQYAEVMKQDFSTIGLNVTFYGTTEKFLSKETAEESPIYITGRVANILDPLLMFNSFLPDTAYDYEQVSDPKFIELYKKAADAGSDGRLKAIQNMSDFLVTNYYVIPILEEKRVYYYRKGIKIGNQFKANIFNFEEVSFE